ncbi:hypothetical protein [Methanosarcina virus MetMV]|jgi:hypothetical protein|nr:hypothetical protein [Methanosarcina virus MetMV]
MTRDELINKLESMKGLAGSGTVLGETIKKVSDFFGTMEPGDIVRTSDGQVSAAPIAYDLWYLYFHQNFLSKYYDKPEEAAHYDYSSYLNNNLNFLSYLPGLKPLKVLTDLKQQLSTEVQEDVFGNLIYAQYENNGIYWINTAFFELRTKDLPLEYPSEGSNGFKDKPNDYVGYVAFPIGQLGVMEVISLFQETELSGYPFAAYASSGYYHQKPAISYLEDKYKPSIQSVPEMFPDMKDAGLNYCFGRHLIESAYYKPEISIPSQNNNNSDGTSAYAPVASRDVELWASNIKDYGEDIKQKLWMRYWIHKDSTFPVPGEFIGILVRPVACPPHVWWFQESNPFLYAGNWMETRNLTSGIVMGVTLEDDRVDGRAGNLYLVSVQGCQIKIESSDFLVYSVGDRVAVLKMDSITPATKAFSSLDQMYLKDSNTYTKTLSINDKYAIIPCTYFRIKV